MDVQLTENLASPCVRNVSAWRHHTFDVQLVPNLLENRCEPLAAAIGKRRALIVTTPTVNRLYAAQICDELSYYGSRVSLFELTCSEQTKTLDQVMHICEEASAQCIDRSGLLVSVGGGVCSDLVTVAASWLRRGIQHVRVPTTLIGQVDAGIGIKGAVNFQGRKSYLGCFHEPTQVIIDPAFLTTLSAYHMRGGFAEIVKIALVRDVELFELVEKHGAALLQRRFRDCGGEGEEVLWRSVTDMLEELEPNLHERNTYERLVDFGHTFSPLLESAARFSLHHGEAVSVDIALSTALAVEMRLLEAKERDRVLAVLQALGLPVHSPLIDPAFCRHALADAALHRGGKPNLVLPSGIGRGCFIGSSTQITDEALHRALSLLSAFRSATRDFAF